MKSIKLANEVFLPIVCQKIQEGHTASINLKGNSMRPFLESDRDVGWLRKSNAYKKGQVVLAEISKGHFVLHRIDDISINGNSTNDFCDNPNACVTLRGDGNPVGTEMCHLMDIRALCFKVKRNGKIWNLESSKLWKFYSWYWTHTLCIRRYQLALYRFLWRHELPQRWKKK